MLSADAGVDTATADTAAATKNRYFFTEITPLETNPIVHPYG